MDVAYFDFEYILIYRVRYQIYLSRGAAHRQLRRKLTIKPQPIILFFLIQSIGLIKITNTEEKQISNSVPSD